MKKTIAFYALVCAFSITVLSSCSIQKRRYSGGFHVEWHGDKNHSKQKQLEQNLLAEQGTVQQTSDSELELISHAAEVIQTSEPPSSEIPIQKKKNFKTRDIVEAINAPIIVEPEKYLAAPDSLGRIQPPAEIHKGAKSSIKTMLAAYGLTLFTIIALIVIASLFLSSTLTLSALVIFLLAYALIILSIILAIIASVKAMYSLWEMKRMPIRYTNRWQAILAIILGLLYLWFLFLLPLIIFFFKVQITKSKEKNTGRPAQPSFDSHE